MLVMMTSIRHKGPDRFLFYLQLPQDVNTLKEHGGTSGGHQPGLPVNIPT